MRIRLRFTVWRFLLAMACFCLVLGMIHDVERTKDDELGWSLIIGGLILSPFLAVLYAMPIIMLVYIPVKHLRARKERRGK